MIGSKYLDFILETLGISIQDYFAKHSDHFQAANTGKGAKKEYIYHGPKDTPKRCAHCGGSLVDKKMTLKTKGTKTWVANGIARSIKDAEGNLYIIWICSCQCQACAKHQRVLPNCIVRFCRYCAHVIYGVLKLLFDDKELVSAHKLKYKTNRGWEAMAFYGEMSTVYRWRQKISGALRMEN